MRALLSVLLASNHYRSVHVLLRRTPPDIKASAKLEIHQVDFARLPAAFPTADDVFIALGTTIKIAGSEAAFRHVDFDFVVNIARAARLRGRRGWPSCRRWAPTRRRASSTAA